MENDRVVKCTEDSGKALVEVAVPESKELPILQFVKGAPLDGCSLDDAVALTQMMVMAYK